MTPLKHVATYGLCLLFILATAHAGDRLAMEQLLTPEGQLQSDLELRDDQAGFAGTTTRLWIVEPDGAVRYEHLLNGQPIEPLRTGSLDREKLAHLADVLSDQDFMRLPEKLGDGSPVNARSISIRFGDTVSTLQLMPGQDPPAALPSEAGGHRDDLGRFAAIFDVLISMLEEQD